MLYGGYLQINNQRVLKNYTHVSLNFTVTKKDEQTGQVLGCISRPNKFYFGPYQPSLPTGQVLVAVIPLRQRLLMAPKMYSNHCTTEELELPRQQILLMTTFSFIFHTKLLDVT